MSGRQEVRGSSPLDSIGESMKHIIDFCVENVEFNESPMRHQLYLLMSAFGNRDIANKIKSAKTLRYSFYTCQDDCAGAYQKTKVAIYGEE